MAWEQLVDTVMPRRKTAAKSPILTISLCSSVGVALGWLRRVVAEEFIRQNIRLAVSVTDEEL